MEIKPIGLRVVIKPEEAKTATESGIILPTGEEAKAQGKIIALGTDKKIQELRLEVGQTVIYSKYSGDEVEVDDGKFLIIKCEDILAIIQ